MPLYLIILVWIKWLKLMNKNFYSRILAPQVYLSKL